MRQFEGYFFSSRNFLHRPAFLTRQTAAISGLIKIYIKLHFKMSWLKKLFGGTQQPKTLLDQAKEAANIIIISGYRRIAAQRDCAPTEATADKEILEVYTRVATAFREVAKQRGEVLPATRVNYIVLYFLQNNELFGGEHMNSHLEYELRKYFNEGLRPTYCDDIRLS